MEGKKYYLGLDIGTDSVGFAVTDENYNLIRKQGKHLWGARLFDEAKDASGRRAQRASRRRLQRRRARIKMLREIMGEEINKIDPLFFKRLDESSLHKEDKSDGVHLPYGFTDNKSLFNKYPTIYHLRKAMLESEEKFDVRLVYLVLAHMIKYRGNFLRQGQIQQGGASPKEVEALFDQINDSIKTLSGSPEDDDYEEPDLFKVSDEQAKKLIDSFKTDIKKSERIDREAEIFGEKPKGVKHAVLSFINGGEVQLVKFFPRLKEDDPDLAKAKIKTDIEDFDNKILEFNLMEEENEFLKTCKSLADVLLLVNLLKGENSITNAMVQVYDDYHKDMVNLRGYINGLVGLGILSKDDKEKFWKQHCGEREQECTRDPEDQEGLSLSISKEGKNLGKVRYSDQKHASIAGADGKTADYSVFLGLVKDAKRNNQAINFSGEMSPEFAAKLKLACEEMGVAYQNAPEGKIDVHGFEDQLSEESKKKLNEYNTKQTYKDYKDQFKKDIAEGKEVDLSNIKDDKDQMIAYAAGLVAAKDAQKDGVEIKGAPEKTIGYKNEKVFELDENGVVKKGEDGKPQMTTNPLYESAQALPEEARAALEGHNQGVRQRQLETARGRVAGTSERAKEAARRQEFRDNDHKYDESSNFNTSADRQARTDYIRSQMAARNQGR